MPPKNSDTPRYKATRRRILSEDLDFTVGVIAGGLAMLVVSEPSLWHVAVVSAGSGLILWALRHLSTLRRMRTEDRVLSRK